MALPDRADARPDPYPLPLHSELDASVNFVSSDPDVPGFQEARYVRRSADEVIVYLSAQTGCRQACRFCHLTQTGQTDHVDVSVDELLAQAERVLVHYDGQPAARLCNFNFMARGEPLASEVILGHGDEICVRLGELAARRGLISRVKISTILPAAVMADRALTDIFSVAQPDIYLSVYSTDPAFRRRWLPKALDVAPALEKLADWQAATRKIPVIHWALIAAENDRRCDAEAIAAAVAAAGLRCDVNLVAYNPANARTGTASEPEQVARYATWLDAALPAGCRVRTVDRVGFDVKASCGMFVS